jgi:CubicO group peptidase (beta-lactamase class C family)
MPPSIVTTVRSLRSSSPLLAASLLTVVLGRQAQSTGQPATPVDFSALEASLERLRARWNVPGMAAGIALKGQIVWSKGFGYADLASRRPATPATVFHLASLTKPFAAVVLLQLVQAGQLDLDSPVERFGIRLEADGVIRVRHLLTHTSEGVPGEVFRYSGNRFAELDKVLAATTTRTFAELLAERVLVPLALDDTSPNPYQPAACASAHRDAAAFLERSARGYAFDGVTPVEYPRHFVTAAGLVSTVGDVLRFSLALDRDELLRPDTKRLAYTPARSSNGRELPYGLGWFVQKRRGVTLLWYYGWDRANSTLLIKVPERDATFVLLGNSEALSRKFDLGRDEDVTRSPFAREFLTAMRL